MVIRFVALYILFCAGAINAAAADKAYYCPDGGPFDSLVHAFGPDQPSAFTCLYGLPEERGGPPQASGSSTRESKLIVEGESCGLVAVSEHVHGPDFTVHICKGDRARCKVSCR